MDSLFVLVLFASLVVAASELVKALFRTYVKNEDIKIGLAVSMLFGLVLSLAWGKGVLAYIGDINYSDALYPAMFMYVDLTLSGILYAGSSKKIIDIYEEVKMLKKPPDIVANAPKTPIGFKKDIEGYDIE